jgi:Mce-associated membrane protein
MSAPIPRPPRRRIAGERRPPRDVEPADPRKPQTPDAAAPPDASRPAPGAPPPPVEPRAASREPGGSGPSWLALAVLGVVALALVLVVAYLGLGKWNIRDVREHEAVIEATSSAPAAAERASAAILSYGYQSLDADESAAERYMTPAYKKKYGDTFDRLVRPNAARIKAKVEAEVKASGVAHADADRVDVLLYVNQTTTSTANGGNPQVALNRVRLSMVDLDGTWLVDDITSY